VPSFGDWPVLFLKPARLRSESLFSEARLQPRNVTAIGDWAKRNCLRIHAPSKTRSYSRMTTAWFAVRSEHASKFLAYDYADIRHVTALIGTLQTAR
jgi:hypothetical protein